MRDVALSKTKSLDILDFFWIRIWNTVNENLMSSGGTLITSKKDFKENVKFKLTIDNSVKLVGNIKSIFFLAIYAFFTHPAAAHFLMCSKCIFGQPLQVLLFPIAAALEIIDVILSSIQLYRNANRTRKQIAEFVLKVVKAIIIVPAVILGVSGTVCSIHLLCATLAPWLFVGATGLQFVFSIANLIFYSVKLYQVKGKKDSELYKKYKQDLKQAIGNVFVDFIVLGATIALFVLFSIVPPAAIIAVASIAIATLAALIIHNVLKSFLVKKTEVLANRNTCDQTIAKGSNREVKKYQGRLCSDKILAELKNKRPEEKKTYFMKILVSKIEKLEKQVKIEYFFARFQKNKREVKIKGLKKLKNFVEKYRLNKNNEIIDCPTYRDIDKIITDKKNHPGLFRSYEKSETKALFDVAKQVFAQQRQTYNPNPNINVF